MKKILSGRQNTRRLIPAAAAFFILNFIVVFAFGQNQNKSSATEEKSYKPELVIQTGSTSLVNSAVISKDGKTLASGGGDDTVRLWDVATGRQIKSFHGHTGYIISVAFSPDERTLASGGFDQTVRLWDVETGKQIKVLKGHTDFVLSIAFSPDGKTLASGSRDKTIRFWNLETGKDTPLEAHNDWVFSVAFSPDGKTLASGSVDKTVKLWDAATKKLIKPLEGHTDQVWSVAFSPDGKKLASAGVNKTVKLWNIADGTSRSIENQNASIYSAIFSPDGKTLAVAGDNVISLWNVEKAAPVRTLTGHTSYIRSVVFSTDGKMLASAGSDKSLRLWNVETGAQIKSIEGHTTHVLSAAFSPNGKMLASVSFDNKIKLWNLESGELTKSFESDPALAALLAFSNVSITTIAFSPDGKILASGDNLEKAIKLWNIETGMPVKSLSGHTSAIHSVAFSRDGKLASGGEDNTVRLWNTETGDGETLGKHEKGVNSVVFSPDGKTLASGGKDGAIKFWNVEKRELIKSLAAHNGEVSSIVFSPDGATLASGGFDRTIKIWNADAKTEARTLNGHAAEITSISFSSDGKTLASGSKDGAVLNWDLESGKYKPLEGHIKEISSVAFAPKKNLFVSSSWDATIKLWRTNEEKPLASLIALDADDWVVVTSESRFAASENAERLMHYVYGLEIIGFEQLKEMYYEPKLLPKLFGFDEEPPRPIVPLKDVKLCPEIVARRFDEKTGRLFITLKSRGGGIGKTEVYVGSKITDQSGGSETEKLVVADARDERLKQNPNVAGGVAVQLAVDLSPESFIAGSENRIRIVTSNYLKEIGRGNIQSRGSEIVLIKDSDQRKLELPTLYAVIGGISDYEGDGLDLRFAAKDAEDFSNALSLGARKLFCDTTNPNCLDKVNITTLSTSREKPEEQPTKENFKRAVERIAAKAKPEDIIVVYLAGHGVTLGTGTDTYFYLTKEARSTKNTDLETTFQTVAISNTELIDWLTPDSSQPADIFIQARKQVIILDTCAAGNFARDEWRTDRKGLTDDQIRAIEFLKDKTGTIVLMGSAENAVAYEANIYNQGLLTYALLEGMKGFALQKATDYVDVRILFDYAANRVPDLAKMMNLDQRPLIKQKEGNNFVIGQMTEAEKNTIILPQPKPLMLRPILTVPPRNNDPLKLIPQLRKKLVAESSYEVIRQRGEKEPKLIYVDEDDFSGAISLTGTYAVEGENVRIKAYLIKDEVVLAELPPIVASAEKVLDELLVAVRNELAKIK